MSSPIPFEEQRRLHRQNTLNAQLGIIAAILGMIVACLGVLEASRRTSPPPTPQESPKTDSATRPHPPVVPDPPAQEVPPGPVVMLPPVHTPPVRTPEPVAPPPISEPPPSPREKYVNGGVIDALAAGSRAAILVLAGSDDAEHRLLSALDGAGFNARTGVFTSAAFRDGMVDRLASGDAEAAAELGLSSVNGHLVVGRISFDPVQNTMQDLMMTHASLSVRIVPLGGGSPLSRSFRARGAGFNESAAIHQAEDRVVQELVQALSSL